MKATTFFVLLAATILTVAVPSQAGGRHHYHYNDDGGYYGPRPIAGMPYYVRSPYPVAVPYSPQVIIVPQPREVVTEVIVVPAPQQSMGQPTFGVNCLGPWCKKDQPAPPQQMTDQQQGSGPQLVTPPPQPRLRQVNVDTATLMKRARIEHHTYGKTYYPDDLRPGEAVVICNAASGPYILESQSQYKGHSYHKQQCWRYDNPLDGPPVEEEVFVK